MGVTRPSLSAHRSSGPTIDNLSGTATGKDLLEDDEVINLYVGRLS
jgi:hypothetical protein